ncbi:hypothetical protein J4209_00505 [Candidatus Woesearchaeota archaeon]|nr:hypothetical protein [Candidatus Woesearchaeota archaeon]
MPTRIIKKVFRIRKEAIFLIAAVFILAFGMFTAPKNEIIGPVGVTGAVTGITGMQTADECIEVPVEDIQWIRDRIDDKMYVAREATGLSIWPYYEKALPSDGNVTDVGHLLDLRYNLMMTLTRFYYDLNMTAQATFIPSSYYSPQSKLFQQAFGKNTWTNPDPKCITQTDLNELERAIGKLRWVLISPGSGSQLSFQITRERTWNVTGRLPRGDNIVCDSAALTCTETTSRTDVCRVSNYGMSYPSGVREVSVMQKEKIYDKCSISPLDFPYELKGAKLLMRIDYSEPNFPMFEKITPVIDIGGNLFTYNTQTFYQTNPFTYSIEGDNFNLANIDFDFNEDTNQSKINNFEIKPTEQDVTPIVIEGARTAKGFLGKVEGIFITPYEETEVELKADEDYLKSKGIDIEEYKKPIEIAGEEHDVITEYDTLICEAKGLGGTVNFKILNIEKEINCDSAECKAKFEVGKDKDIEGWPRGEKIKCTANEIGSNEAVVSGFNYIFVHVEPGPEVTNYKEQYKFYTDLSVIDDNIKSASKPVYLKEKCKVNLEKKSATTLNEVDNCVRNFQIRWDPSVDRIIAMSDYFGPYGGFTTKWVEGLVGGELRVMKDDTLFIGSNKRSVPHELAHTHGEKGSCDEYSYGISYPYGICDNDYPWCCIDSPENPLQKRLTELENKIFREDLTFGNFVKEKVSDEKITEEDLIELKNHEPCTAVGAECVYNGDIICPGLLQLRETEYSACLPEIKLKDGALTSWRRGLCCIPFKKLEELGETNCYKEFDEKNFELFNCAGMPLSEEKDLNSKYRSMMGYAMQPDEIFVYPKKAKYPLNPKTS